MQINLIQEIKSLMRKYGYESPFDYEVVVTSLAFKRITITPFKGICANLRRELLVLVVTNGFTPIIKDNPA